MVNIAGTNIPTPKLPSLNLGDMTIYFWIFIIFIVGAGIIYFAYNFRMYNKRIVVFENVSGQGFQPVFKDKAKVIKIGDGGEEIMWLKKKKVYRTAYGRKMGKNIYWFAIGQDGYWYNIVLGDVDAKMGMLDVEPVDKDMRMFHVAVRKNIIARYRKQKFMEKYGTVVMNSIFLLIMIIGIGFLISQMGDANAVNLETAKVNLEVINKQNDILTALNNICTGGSGID